MVVAICDSHYPHIDTIICKNILINFTNIDEGIEVYQIAILLLPNNKN